MMAQWMKRNSWLLLVLLVFGLFTLFELQAGNFGSKDDDQGWHAQWKNFVAGENITLDGDNEHPYNIYIAGGEVAMKEAVGGDLIVMGGTVEIDSTVKDDLFVAGGEIKLLGTYGGDVRIAGGEVEFNGRSQGSIVVAAGKLHIKPMTEIKGDLVIFGGDVVIEGDVTGDLKVIAGDLELNGTVGGLASINADHIELGSHAKIGDDLIYMSGSELIIDSNATVGGKTVFQSADGAAAAWTGDKWGNLGAMWSGWWFFRLLMSILFAVTCFVIMGRRMNRYLLPWKKEGWSDVFVGFIVLCMLPIVIFLLCITLVGIPVAFFVGLAYIGMLMVASVLAAVSLGSWLMQRMKNSESVLPDWRVVVLGVVALHVVETIPLFGWLASFIIWCGVIGRFSRLFYREWQKA